MYNIRVVFFFYFFPELCVLQLGSEVINSWTTSRVLKPLNNLHVKPICFQASSKLWSITRESESNLKKVFVKEVPHCEAIPLTASGPACLNRLI